MLKAERSDIDITPKPANLDEWPLLQQGVTLQRYGFTFLGAQRKWEEHEEDTCVVQRPNHRFPESGIYSTTESSLFVCFVAVLGVF